MRTSHLAALLIWLFGGPAGLPAQAQPPSKALKAGVAQQIQSYYVPTKLSGGRQVKQLGSVLIVQRDGIGALPAPAGFSFASTFGSNYKEGKMRHDFLSGVVAADNIALRDLQVGEPVYLLKVDVKDSSIVLEVQTCGPCDPNVVFPDPYRAAVTFPFKKGYLESMPFELIARTIGEVFAPANPNGPAPVTTDPVPQAFDNAPQTAPPPPPPDGPGTPVKIELGQTPEQVMAALGPPDKIVDLGSKKIFVYKDLKITFLDGKVTDVQ